MEWLIVAQSVNTRSDTRSAMMRFGMLNGPERRSARIGYQVQIAREESLGSMILTDIDKADTG